MHVRQSCSTSKRQLACYCVKQPRRCTAESPLQQASEAAAKKQADADKPQAAAPAHNLAAADKPKAAAADKPQAAAAAVATPGSTLFETEATPSAQDGPGEAPLLQEHLCKPCCIVTDVIYTRLTDHGITNCVFSVSVFDVGDGAMNTGIHRLRLAHCTATWMTLTNR